MREADPRRPRWPREDPVDPAVLGDIPGRPRSTWPRWSTSGPRWRAFAPEQRAILVLRDVDGLSEAEAARLLGVAEGTVKSRLHRARSAFARRWEP